MKQPKLQEVLVWHINRCVCCVFNCTMLLIFAQGAVELPTSLFIGQLSQFQPLLDSISAVRRYTTSSCRGTYIQCKLQLKVKYKLFRSTGIDLEQPVSNADSTVLNLWLMNMLCYQHLYIHLYRSSCGNWTIIVNRTRLGRLAA